jgi:beta-1,2-mannobiose phosphorylase / 1,2-beta-oligomannan phosphorylase
VGTYRTFYAHLDADDPSVVLEVEDTTPVLEARPDLTDSLKSLSYLTGVVFTTGLVEDGGDFIVASGEDDLACRITRIPKSRFGI